MSGRLGQVQEGDAPTRPDGPSAAGQASGKAERERKRGRERERERGREGEKERERMLFLMCTSRHVSVCIEFRGRISIFKTV